MIIKVLEHKIKNAEPSVLIDNILLINTPYFAKKIQVENVLYSHVHKDNTRGISKVLSKKNTLIKTYMHKDHESLFRRDNINADEKCAIKHIVPNKSFKVRNIKITPIHVRHKVQGIYGELNLAFLLNKNVLYCTPCNSIPKKNLRYFKNLDVLIIDGGYTKNAKYSAHMSVHGVLKMVEVMNIKQIYFLGTYRNYNICGKMKNSNTKVDTLFTGDIIKVK